jgi:hypothetical protein
MSETQWHLFFTGINVFLTFIICIANYNSSKETRKQTAESMRQFEESNRAFVTVTFELIKSGLAVLHIQNHGKRIAQNVKVKVSPAFIANMADQADREHLEKLCNASFSLGIGQSWYSCIGSHLDLDQVGKELLKVDISYQDSSSQYHDSFVFDLRQYFWAMIYESSMEEARKELQDINRKLSSIGRTFTSFTRFVSSKSEASREINN